MTSGQRCLAARKKNVEGETNKIEKPEDLLSNLPVFQTGDERIELPLKVLETLVIPFDQSPIHGILDASHLFFISYPFCSVNIFLEILICFLCFLREFSVLSLLLDLLLAKVPMREEKENVQEYYVSFTVQRVKGIDLHMSFAV